MEKLEFKKFCYHQFKKHGFQKIKNRYYLKGKDNIICVLELQKSDYGSYYYINYDYYINPPVAPEMLSSYISDLIGRILIFSKNDYAVIGAAIEYEKYTEEELIADFDDYFNKVIIPPIKIGKTILVKYLNTFYHLHVHKENVLKKLNLTDNNIISSHIDKENYIKFLFGDRYL